MRIFLILYTLNITGILKMSNLRTILTQLNVNEAGRYFFINNFCRVIFSSAVSPTCLDFAINASLCPAKN